MQVHINELPHDVMLKVLLVACTYAVQGSDSAVLQVSQRKQHANLCSCPC
jgi:hypothetical protein